MSVTAERAELMLFDTDILIWIFRGNRKAAALVEETGERHISVVVYMELLQGAGNKREAKDIADFLSDAGFGMLPLTENIGHRAAIYLEEYGLKSGLSMADALVAATAVENRLALCTGNQKHYRSIIELETKVFRP